MTEITRCPFFKNRLHVGSGIVCEGIIPGSRLRNSFVGNLADQKVERQMRNFCCADYKECPVYQAIKEKYE